MNKNTSNSSADNGQKTEINAYIPPKLVRLDVHSTEGTSHPSDDGAPGDSFLDTDGEGS